LVSAFTSLAGFVSLATGAVTTGVIGVAGFVSVTWSFCGYVALALNLEIVKPKREKLFRKFRIGQHVL
jgi:hypothetical protein